MLDKKLDTESVFIIGGSIILAGLMIAGAILYVSNAFESGGKSISTPEVPSTTQNEREFRPVDKSDHVRGKRDARVFLIEYSDTECPYCIMFHDVLKQAVEVYEGDVAWVYRHAPFHNQSEQEIKALECAYDQGGDSAFWAYLDSLFGMTPGNDQFDLALLPTIAQRIGLDIEPFESCVVSKDVSLQIQRDTQDAITAGLSGTPYTLIVGEESVYPIDGFVSFEVLSSFIDQILEE